MANTAQIRIDSKWEIENKNKIQQQMKIGSGKPFICFVKFIAIDCVGGNDGGGGCGVVMCLIFD